MGHFLSGYFADFAGRFDGPLHFRLFAQPLMALLLATRDGRKDSRAGRSAYLWTLFSDPAQRRYLLEDGWKGISRIFFLAFALDVIYQLMVWRGLKPLQGLLTAATLAVVPYLLLRGPVNRMMSIGRSTRSAPPHRKPDD